MSVPAPPVALAPGGCSTIYQNTLYTYDSTAFQSLPLQAGATWDSHPMGVAANGSRCVLGTQQGQDVLFVVGGAANASQSNYTGLQRWGFRDQSWQTIAFGSGTDSVLQNRLGHGAAFLNDSATILVYSGYQDDSGGMSSQTFTISTEAPEALAHSYVSNHAPPGKAPMLLPWNSSHAVMAGGNADNQQVWTFGIEDGWQQVPVLLPKSVANMTTSQGSLLQGSNGSKILEVFDLSKSPNTVTGLLVQPGDGPSPKRAADANHAVDPTDQPAYNSTFAPLTTRAGYALAQAPNGLVVVSGGAANSADSIAIFNQTGNTWVDGAHFFDPAKSAVPSHIPTPPPAATSSPADPLDGGSPDYTRMILGAVLGSIFGGIALAGILFLVCLYTGRRRRDKRRSSGFAERKHSHGGQPMHATGANIAGFAPAPSPARRYFSQRELSSPEEGDRSSSPDHLIARIPASAVVAPPRHPGRSDQGWSQYFMGDAQRSARPHDPADLSRLTAYTEESEYTNPEGHASAEVAPLSPRGGGAWPYHGERPSGRDTFLDSSTTSQHEAWDPIRTSAGAGGYGDRADSSLYGESLRGSAQPHSGNVVIPSFPSVPSRSASIVQPGDEERGLRTTASRDLSGIPEDRRLYTHPPPRNPRRSRSSKVMDDMSWLSLRKQ